MAKKGRPNTGTITHRGEHQFHARFSHDGQRVARTFETYEQAQQWLAGLTDGRGKDRFAKTIEARDLTLAEAMTNRLEMKKDLKSHVEQTRQTERLIRNFPDLTGKRLYEIDEIDILDFIEKREEAVGGATINRELSLICNTFNLARTKMRCTRLLNPIGPTTWLKESKGRDHRLAEDEEALLFRVAERADPEHQTPIADIIRFAIATAMRMSEIGAMDWRNVDLTRGSVLIPDSKNGSPRLVPMGLATRALLRERGQRASGCVWASTAAIASAWQRLKRAAIVEARELASKGLVALDLPERLLDLRFHDLRHEATSQLVERTGWENARIKAVTGHKTDRMLERYTHLRTANLASELAALEGGAVMKLRPAGGDAAEDSDVCEPTKRSQWRAVSSSATLLQLLIAAKPIVEIAREYGVSDVAVHKACDRLGIEKPGRGHWLAKDRRSAA